MTFRLNPTYRYFGLAGVVALQQGTTDTPANLEGVQGKLTVVPYFWNPDTLAFEVGRQPSTGGGAGSSSVDARLSSAGTTAIAGYFSLTPTTPGSSNDYLWVRTVGASGAGSTIVDVNSISSSTAHIGDVSISNPTTSVTITNPATAVTVSNPTTSVTLTNPATAVNVANQPTVDLSSVGSTRLVGRVEINTPTTLVSVSSGVVLAAGSSSNVLGAVAQGNGSTSVSPWYVISTASAGAGSTTVDANLSSAGSTRVVGTVNVSSGVVLGAGSSANLVGAVAVSSGVVLGAGSTSNSLGSVALVAGSSANTVGAIAQGAGSTSVAPWYVISTASAGAGSTTVDAQASSVGSTKLFGQVTVANPTTAVTVSSGVVLGAGSSANVLGQIAQGAGSTSIAPWYVISTASAGAGSTTVDANLTSAGSTRVVGTVNVSSGVVLGAGSTTNSIGSVALVAGSSGNTVGAIAQGAGSTSIAPWYVISTASAGAGSTSVDVANTPTVLPGSGSSSVAPWFVAGYGYSSGQTSHTTLATSAEVQLAAANPNRRGMMICNLSTAVDLIVGFTTATISTARANADFLIPASGRLWVGQDTPLYLGPVRGRLNSTTLAGIAAVLQFTS